MIFLQIEDEKGDKCDYLTRQHTHVRVTACVQSHAIHMVAAFHCTVCLNY